MAWNETTRDQYDRKWKRHESDPSDAEWLVISPLLPAPSRLGRHRTTELREAFNAIRSMLARGQVPDAQKIMISMTCNSGS